MAARSPVSCRVFAVNGGGYMLSTVTSGPWFAPRMAPRLLLVDECGRRGTGWASAAGVRSCPVRAGHWRVSSLRATSR